MRVILHQVDNRVNRILYNKIAVMVQDHSCYGVTKKHKGTNWFR